MQLDTTTPLAKIDRRPDTTLAINPSTKLTPNNSPTLVSFSLTTTPPTQLYNPYSSAHNPALANDCATDLATLLGISYKAACFILNSQYEESQRLSAHPRSSAHYQLVMGSSVAYALYYLKHCPALFTATKLISSERISHIMSAPANAPATAPTHSTGFSPLTCTCNACGGRFKVLRTDPDLYRYEPRFCIFCGQSNLVVTQGSTDDTAFDALAAHYHMARPIIEMIYNQWTSTPTTYTTFAAYVAAFRASNANANV